MLDIEADLPLTPQDERETTRLLALAESIPVDPADLDEDVHDAAARYASDECNDSAAVDNDEAADECYDEAGHQAAKINNGGLSSQVPYLVAQYGATRTEKIIRDTRPTPARPTTR
ncbi:hypothetical protein [Streptomyces nanshensis]|uniref:Uncharacterized protein n=1 Tax=Streptomyces nanshensis TaxID=518642 RepID=A0A1E7LC83_9ACTN|nr:hypothetical protein [Streptomyces nanshensis]OEV13796.1 hypothetical protein AN218_01815 [Streptomyces nanshensis]